MVLFLEIVVAAATVVLALATFFMAKSSSAMAAAASNIAEIVESDRQMNHQPIMMVFHFFKNSRKSEFRIRVKNIGKGAARWVSVQVGDNDWHSVDRVFALRESESARGLGPGEEDEWTIPETEARIIDGRLWVGVLYEGMVLPPGAANFGTWASVLTISDAFDVELSS